MFKCLGEANYPGMQNIYFSLCPYCSSLMSHTQLPQADTDYWVEQKVYVHDLYVTPTVFDSTTQFFVLSCLKSAFMTAFAIKG